MKISVMTGGFSRHIGAEAAIRLLAEAGFEAMDFTIFGEADDPLRSAGWSEVEATFKRLKAVADECGIAFGQIHTPFPPLTGDDARDAECFRLTEWSLRACAILDCPYAVVHPKVLPGRKYNNMAAENKALNMDYYARLLPALDESGARIAIENMFGRDARSRLPCGSACSYPEELCDYVDALNAAAGAERFVACLDVGHAHLLRISPADFARALGKRLRVLHLHDNDGATDLHQAPLLGGIDWEPFMKALAEIGYEGTLSIESDGFQRAFGGIALRESAALLAALGKALISGEAWK